MTFVSKWIFAGVTPPDCPQLLYQLLHLPRQAGGRRDEDPETRHQGARGDGDGESYSFLGPIGPLELGLSVGLSVCL